MDGHGHGEVLSEGRRGSGTYHDKRRVDVSAGLLGVAVVIGRVIRLLLALFAYLQLVLQWHSVKIVCAQRMNR